MSLTRVYQCPGCGNLISTRKDPSKIITCPSCKVRGQISKHSVSTPMTVARKKRAKQKELVTKGKSEVEAPFTKDQLLGRIEMPKEETKEDPPEDTSYTCEDCGAKITKGQAHCAGCGVKLNWEGVK